MQLPLKEFANIRKFYVGRFPFRQETTGSSAKLVIEAEKTRYFFSDGPRYYARHFQLIKAVKEEAENFSGSAPPFPWHEVNEEALTGRGGEVDGYEMDCSQAYIASARATGVLSDSLCKSLEKTEKKYRWRIMGAMATKKTIEEFNDAGRCVKRWEEKSAKGCKAWRAICGKVALDLHEASCSDKGFVFFWVDNYYTTNYSAAAAIRRNYRVKIRKAKFQYDHKETRIKIDVQIGDRLKPFLIPCSRKRR